MKKRKITHICTSCGSEETATRRRRGNGFVELVLWLALLVPGILYTAWRNMGDPVTSCYVCGHQTTIPLHTPVGRRMHEELEQYRDSVLAASK